MLRECCSHFLLNWNYYILFCFKCLFNINFLLATSCWSVTNYIKIFMYLMCIVKLYTEKKSYFIFLLTKCFRKYTYQYSQNQIEINALKYGSSQTFFRYRNPFEWYFFLEDLIILNCYLLQFANHRLLEIIWMIYLVVSDANNEMDILSF